MPPRRNPDLFGNLLLLGVVVAGGVWLAKTVRIGGGPLVDGLPRLGVPPGGSDNRWSAKNGQNGTAVNINTHESHVVALGVPTQIVGGGQSLMSGHVGFGHIGAPMTANVAVWASSGLGIGPLTVGQVGPALLTQQNVPLAQDADWTGYGIDFDNAVFPGSWVGGRAWADIRDATDMAADPLAQAQIG
jgi:hypothetical protein